MLQPVQHGGGQARRAAEGDVQAAGEDPGGGAGEPAVEARGELEFGRGGAGGGQHPVAGAHRRADVDEQRTAGGREGGGQFVVGGEHAPGVRQQPLPLGGQPHRAGRPHEQFGPQFPLQAPDVPAQRLLRDVEAGGGLGEVQFLRDGGEGPQQARVDGVRHPPIEHVRD